MVRTIAEIALVALLILVGFTWWNTKQDRDAQRDRAVQYIEDLDEASQLVDSLEAALIETDSIGAVEDSVHEAEISEAETAVNEQASKADSLLQIVLSQVPDSTAAVVQLLHNSYQEQLSNKDRIIASLESQVAIRNTRILARDDLISALASERDEALELARFWEKEAKPKFTVRLQKNLGLIGTSMVAGGLLTYAVSQ